MPLHVSYNKQGLVALHLARFLVAQGANDDTQDGNERTPLFIACQSGNVDLAAFLFKAGANINTRRGVSGRTLLHKV